MIRDFSREELESVPAKNDAELTLGIGTILGLGGAFLFICAICFGLGYMVGRRASPDREFASALPPARSSAAPPAAAGPKPGAGEQVAKSSQTPTSGAVSDTEVASPGRSVIAAAGSDVSSQASTSVSTKVRPALGISRSEGQSDPALRVQPATAQVQGWMVQIAAVSRAEDAAVLVNALRKRGYSVSARRELGDNLVHVQTGPFANRNDANAMRQKLLGDGYNAIVQ